MTVVESTGAPHPPAPAVCTISCSPGCILRNSLAFNWPQQVQIDDSRNLVCRLELDDSVSSTSLALVVVGSATLTVESAVCSVRRNDTSLTIVACFHGHERFVHTSDTVSTAVLTIAARSAPNGELAQNGRKSRLKQLEITDTRVGHVGVHRRLAMPRWTG